MLKMKIFMSIKPEPILCEWTALNWLNKLYWVIRVHYKLKQIDFLSRAVNNNKIRLNILIFFLRPLQHDSFSASISIHSEFFQVQNYRAEVKSSLINTEQVLLIFSTISIPMNKSKIISTSLNGSN